MRGTAGEGIQHRQGWGFTGFGDVWETHDDGGGGGGGNSGRFRFIGENAKQLLVALQEAYKNAGEGGQWSLSIWQNQSGNIGFSTTSSKARLAILFTGADFGQGMTPSTLSIMNQVINSNPGIEATTYSSSYYLDYEEGTNAAYNQIANFHDRNPDGVIVLYGYSYGGVLVNYLANRLYNLGINITYMATVDAANGFASGSVDRFIPPNIMWNDNFYQTNSDISKSHGDANGGYNVHNYPMPGTTHYTIDDVTIPIVVHNMNAFLK